jgi:hypothetical protein
VLHPLGDRLVGAVGAVQFEEAGDLAHNSGRPVVVRSCCRMYYGVRRAVL